MNKASYYFWHTLSQENLNKSSLKELSFGSSSIKTLPLPCRQWRLFSALCWPPCSPHQAWLEYTPWPFPCVDDVVRPEEGVIDLDWHKQPGPCLACHTASLGHRSTPECQMRRDGDRTRVLTRYPWQLNWNIISFNTFFFYSISYKFWIHYSFVSMSTSWTTLANFFNSCLYEKQVWKLMHKVECTFKQLGKMINNSFPAPGRN